MPEHAPDTDSSDAIRQLGEIIAIAGVTRLRYLEFIGRKAARVFMEEVGLTLEDDEVGNAALEDLLGTGVATGITLGATRKTTLGDIDEQATRLSSQMPAPLRPSFGALMPHLISYGIDLHCDEIVPGSERIEAWTVEFRQLQASDPRHELWGE